MAIDDNTSYELTGAQVKDLANKIKAKAADNIFVGATSAAPGSKGLVPQPQAGDNEKFLKGDGTWATVSGGGPTVVQTTGQSTTDVMSQKAVTDLVGSTISLDQGPSSSMASGTVIKSSLTQAEFNKIAAATASGSPALFRFDDNSGDAWFYRVSAITPVDSTTVVVDVLYDGGLSWQHQNLEKLTFMAYAPGAAYPNGGIELINKEESGGTIKLADVPYTSFTTSVSTTYQLDLRTLFCNGSANREFYFDALLVDIELFTPVQSSATYFRFGTLSTSTACHRRMITFSGNLSADSNDAPNIILSANGELSETLIVTPVNVSLQTDVDSVTRFVFSHYAGTQFNDDFRLNVGSFVRLENMPNGKVPCFIETAPTAGKMTIYGVRYGR